MRIIRTKKELKKAVKKILLENGISSAYNKTDFKDFRKKTKQSFYPAVAIAEMFIDEYFMNSDFRDYEF